MPHAASRLSVCATTILTGLLLSVSPAWADAASDAKAAPSGTYVMDPSHASVTFKINHLGFSHFTGRFDKLEGTLNYNSNAPEQSALDVTVYPNSVNTNSVKLDDELRGDKWFDVIKFPRATYHVTKIERTGATTGKISGDFTLHGVTRTVVLDATLVGTGIHPFTKKQVLGFSAVGTINRSDFGVPNLTPMVGDEVTLQIEAEFDQAE
jgi:polyisoprenoid-binding protein YceI